MKSPASHFSTSSFNMEEKAKANGSRAKYFEMKLIYSNFTGWKLMPSAETSKFYHHFMAFTTPFA